MYFLNIRSLARVLDHLDEINVYAELLVWTGPELGKRGYWRAH